MSNELTRKIIEAGIVPAHAVKQLKAWRQLPADMPEEEKQEATQQQLMEFVGEIGELLEESTEVPELRETIPGIDALFEVQSKDCTVVVNMAPQSMTLNIRAMTDRLDCLIFKADRYGEMAARIGNQASLGDGKVYEITEIAPLYHGKEVSFYRCRVQEVPDYAQMSEMRQLGQ
jgi:hypothetical protein